MKESRREELKKLAVEGAVDWLRENYDLKAGLRVGVGSGTTVSYSFPKLARYDNLTAVPTSRKTERELQRLGVNTDELKESDDLLFDIDGADEVDPQLNLMKGGGGSHFWEKKVAVRSETLVIVADQTKLVDNLGQTFPLPVEVEPDSRRAASQALERYGTPRIRRGDDGQFRTDSDNLILDVELSERFPPEELYGLEREINKITGVVENGFFVNRKADIVFVGTEDGLNILGEN